jgi:pyruvate formate lyase activating enzyme
MNIENKLTVTEIQRFCMHDGPGVRTTVFLKGCPLRCAWCHNPETQKFKSELLFYPKKCIGCAACTATCPVGAHSLAEWHTIDREKCILCGKCVDNCPTGALEKCGREYTVEEILSVVEKDRSFYGEKGGITVSGGEPFARGEAVIALLQACKARGLSTAMETSGYADPAVILAALPYVDLFLWDIKDTDGERHKRYTGVSNEKILQNLSLVNDMNARIRLRCILVNGVNTDARHYSAIADIANKINNLDGVEWIPYHAYGGTKAVFLGLEDNGRKEWIPKSEEIERAKAMLKKLGVAVL